LILGAALALWPPGWKAVAWSAITFALMHLQYHGFRVNGLSLAQLAWTLPTGAVFAVVAMRTRSLIVVLLLHIANNAIVLLS
jgi:membrane protease YdiL (CAAX protease family)